MQLNIRSSRSHTHQGTNRTAANNTGKKETEYPLSNLLTVTHESKTNGAQLERLVSSKDKDWRKDP